MKWQADMVNTANFNVKWNASFIFHVIMFKKGQFWTKTQKFWTTQTDDTDKGLYPFPYKLLMWQ